MASYVDTYVDYTKSRVSHSKRKVVDRLTSNPGLLVRVNNGLHSCEQTQIEARTFTIGGDPNDELMLLDDCMEGSCVHVDTQTTILGELIKIHTDRNDVTVNGTIIVASSEYCKLPCVLKIGDVELSLSVGETIDGGRSYGFYQFSAYGFLLTALCAFGLSNLPLAYDTRPTVSLDLQVNESAQSVPSIDIAAMITFSKSALEKAGLAQFLETSIIDEAIVKIDGIVPPERMAEWH